MEHKGYSLVVQQQMAKQAVWEIFKSALQKEPQRLDDEAAKNHEDNDQSIGNGDWSNDGYTAERCARTPRLEIPCTIIDSTISSTLATVAITVASRVISKPLVPSTVNVVAKLIEQSETPAANACNGVAFVRK